MSSTIFIILLWLALTVRVETTHRHNSSEGHLYARLYAASHSGNWSVDFHQESDIFLIGYKNAVANTEIWLYNKLKQKRNHTQIQQIQNQNCNNTI